MTHRKKLIEVALPLEAINEASAREKSIRHGHPSTLHLWWARRPLAAARAVIFASLVDDPDDPEAPPEFVEACNKLPAKANALVNNTPRMRLFDFIEDLVKWESTTDERIIGKARELINLSTGGNPPPLLDPFAGGGTIPLEAQRLGLEAHASDLNPVAVMINKAMIEIPPRFANMPPVNPRDREQIGGKDGWKGAAGLAADVRYYGEWMREKARERIGHLYPEHNGETVIAWIWARTVPSPNPAINAYVPLVKSFWLSKKKGSLAWIEPQVDKRTSEVTYHVMNGDGKPQDGTMSRSGGRCIITNSPITYGYIKEQAKKGNLRTQLMAVATVTDSGRSYYAPSDEQMAPLEALQPNWSPNYDMSTHPQYMGPPRYGMEVFGDLFTTRQLVALNTFVELLSDVQEIVARKSSDVYGTHNTGLSEGGNGGKAYAEAITVFLSFVINRMVNLNNNLCQWRPDAAKQHVGHLFARQAIPMIWDFAEANPLGPSAGGWDKTFLFVPKVLDGLVYSALMGKVLQEDATNISAPNGIIISTDPPYYDAVPYADLADFFYVWLRQSLKDVYPEVFGTMLVPKTMELVADQQRFGGRDKANEHFEDGMFRVFINGKEFVSSEFPLTVYYAFKQVESSADGERNSGWETILDSLLNSGYMINGTWPMRTELGNRVRSIGSNALASSIVLVCRPRPDNAPSTSRREFINTLRRELPKALQQMQSGNIAPVDLAQAAIGPGMAVYSRYSKVLEADGSPLSVRTALQIINQELDAYFSEQEGDVDGDTRFAIAWFDQNGFEEGVFGQADVLARAKNTSVDGIVDAGIAVAGQGKVRLIRFTSGDPDFEVANWNPNRDKRPTVWEGTHYLIERLTSHGETGAAMLLNQMSSDLAAESRQLAYRLYSICERKGWAELARDYNALVISFPRIQEEASELRRQQAESGTQLDMFGEE